MTSELPLRTRLIQSTQHTYPQSIPETMERTPSIGSDTNPLAATKKHILFDLTPLDQRLEELDEKSQRCYQVVSQLVAGKSPRDRHEIYSKHIASNPQANSEELIIGLAVALMTVEHQEDASKVQEYYQDIVTISKDNLVCFSSFVNQLIVDRITKMTENVLKRVFWIANQLLKAGAVTAEAMCSNLIRQTAKSDLSERNLFMAENVISLLIENRTWLVRSTQFMVPTVIYNLMRLINDHANPVHKALRQKEIDFVIGLIRERFDLVIGIGRDFLRQLQYLLSSKIPEFQQLYQDIYHSDPKMLHPTYEGAQQLLATRTPRRLFQTCLTYDMERKISYMATQVKFGNQKRYQEWFSKSHFTGHDFNSLLRCDIIRYICTIIHPSNEVLCSDIIPRWAIIGWLLTTSSHVVQSCRSALFFDWFAYDPKTDNIMNIEPGILIMAHSVRSHPQVTSNLLEFLCRAPSMFPPKIAPQVRSGIKKSLQQILEKRVIQSLTPVFLNPKFDSHLKQLVRESFPEYCQTDNDIIAANVIPPQRTHPPSASLSSTQTPPATSTSSIQLDASIKNPKTNTSQLRTSTGSPEVIVLDESPLEAQPNLDTNEAVQDVNHNARKDSDTADPAKRLKQNQRPPVIKTSGRAEPDLEIGPAESAKLDVPERSKQNPSSKIDSPRLEDSFGGKYGFNTGQDDLILPAKSSQNELNSLDGRNFSGTNHFYDLMPNDMLTLDAADIEASAPKVVYPFMTIKTEACKVAKHLIEPFEDILDELSNSDCSSEDRCNLMRKLLDILSDKYAQLGTKDTNELNAYLANRLVHPLSEDFTTRILASPTHDFAELEKSISKPLFILCREVFQDTKTNPSLIKILVALTKLYRATSFLVLYFMRARYCIWNTTSSQHYIAYCEACGRDLNDALQEDLEMMCTYDSEMFCFTIPSIFSEYATSGFFNITNNVSLIHKTVSALDPVSLQELMCLCLTGTCKVINRENPKSVIEASLNWESWEQYCFWKLLSAQSVPLENYTSLISTMDAKSHPEALSSIMLNLQKCEEPSTTILSHLINAHKKQNEQFVVSVIRHWAIKTDVKELAEKMVSLIDARSSPIKRKGQNRANNKSPSLSANDERILKILDHIRFKAPRNKLFTQVELFEGLADLESVCDDNHKKQFAQLFAHRQIVTTKRKKTDRDAT